MVSNIYR